MGLSLDVGVVGRKHVQELLVFGLGVVAVVFLWSMSGCDPFLQSLTEILWYQFITRLI